MTSVERFLGRALEHNNARIRRREGEMPNPRDTSRIPWVGELAGRWSSIRAEWDQFDEAGGRLPRIEEVISESQGNEGPWRAGLLVARGRPCGVAKRFPVTVAALGGVPGLRSALWSQLEPGTELPEHVGPNAGVLRYHLGVRCGTGSALLVGDQEIPFRDGESVLFDDTAPHAAWNRGPAARVTLFCEIDRPLVGVDRAANAVVQTLISLDERYRTAPNRAAELDAALNGSGRG